MTRTSNRGLRPLTLMAVIALTLSCGGDDEPATGATTGGGSTDACRTACEEEANCTFSACLNTGGTTCSTDRINTIDNVCNSPDVCSVGPFSGC